MLSYILIVSLYIETGNFDTTSPRTTDIEAWEYCIRKVDGTDTDMEFCDWAFDPTGELARIYELEQEQEANDGRF